MAYVFLIFFLVIGLAGCDQGTDLAQPPGGSPQLPYTGFVLPEELHGWWFPGDIDAANLEIAFQDNGWLIYRLKDSHEEIYRYPYRVIEVFSAPKAALLIAGKNNVGKPAWKYWMIEYTSTLQDIETDQDKMRLHKSACIITDPTKMNKNVVTDFFSIAGISRDNCQWNYTILNYNRKITN